MEGQVVGGRWKPLMHLMESTLFTDVITACGRENNCYVRNDGAQGLEIVISAEAWSLEQAEATNKFNYTFSLASGGIGELFF